MSLCPCRLFPPELFEMFIDIGHYVRDIAAYVPLQERISVLSVSLNVSTFRCLLRFFPYLDILFGLLSDLILSCPVYTYFVWSCHVLSYLILSYLTLYCPILSCLTLSCIFLSYLFLSYLFLLSSYFILSYLILSYLVLSFLILFVLFCPALSDLIWCYLVL